MATTGTHGVFAVTLIDSHAISDESLMNDFDNGLIVEKVELESMPREAKIHAVE